MATDVKDVDASKFNVRDDHEYRFESGKGLSRDLVKKISRKKDEPEWMRDLRLRSYDIFRDKPMPTWGVDLSELDFEEITFYREPDADRDQKDWDEVPDDIKNTFDRLGIPEAEKKSLSGVGAQYESEVVYQQMKERWQDKGVIFCNMDKAVEEHPQLVKDYFMTQVVPPGDNKFSALHGAVWSGGSFVYVPEDVEIEIPVQAYFRMNAESGGQFEHTLIIAEEGSEVHYIEGCSAPQYTSNALHAGCVEVIVKDNARVRYSTVQNWSKNTYNLNTKRAFVEQDGTMEWISGTMGSYKTMLYPCSVLRGKGAKCDHIAIAFAGEGQHLDNGAKAIHAAPHTSSKIEMKSISKGGGWAAYRGLLRINKGAKGAKSTVDCDALMLDKESKSDTIPVIEILENDVDVGHEAAVGRISEEQVYYLMSRGLEEDEAYGLIVNGFIEPVVEHLPLEYAVELNRLMELEMEDSIG